MKKHIRQHIPTWLERCEINRLSETGTIQARMQAEIDDLRAALEVARNRLNRIDKYVLNEYLSNCGGVV